MSVIGREETGAGLEWAPMEGRSSGDSRGWVLFAGSLEKGEGTAQVQTQAEQRAA